MISLSQSDNGGLVEMKVGEALAVTLPENATTGYRWAVDDYDPGLFAAVDAVADYAGGQIGSGGSVSFTFIAACPGSGMIALKNWRPWEGETDETERFSVTVTVRP